MLNTWLDLKACKYCRRPVLETHGDQLYCPTCDTKYHEDDILFDELEVVSCPSFDVFERNVNLLMEKGGPYRDESGHWRFTRLLDKFGIDTGAFAEQWILAASHLWYLYYASQITAKYPNSPRELLSSQRPPLRSKRSTSGYLFTYLRTGTSPFTFLSNDSFMIIMESSYNNPKTNCPFIPKSNKGIFYYCLNEQYQQGNWQKGIEGLLAAGLIEHAPFETNLALLTLEKIRQKLKEYGHKRGKNKDEAIATATKELPVNILHELIKPVQGYVPTALAMKEFRLWDYEIRCLQDAVRYHNLTSMEKKTEEEYSKWVYHLRGTPEHFEIVVAMLENARSASNYGTYLESGLIPVEALLAEAYVELKNFDSAYREVKRAYELDIQYNDVTSLANINHFRSLTIFQEQLEILLSEIIEPSRSELASNLSNTQKTLRKWTTLYERGSSASFTPFLLVNYESIFETFGDCSRDSENKYRDKVGVPRIGEGWVEEAELLNMVRDIFRKEKVVHQASPEWLGLQRFDIYLPGRKIAIEYQGIQHYEPIHFFGGEEGLLRTRELDRRKARLCAENGVTLIYFRFDEPITREIVKARVEEVNQN